MGWPSRGTYEIAGQEVIAEGADLRVQVPTLDAGQAIPWHYHSEITDQSLRLEQNERVQRSVVTNPLSCVAEAEAQASERFRFACGANRCLPLAKAGCADAG